MSRLPGGCVNSIAELLTGDALYLFYCGVQWRKCGDTDAGGELVRALLSKDPDLSVERPVAGIRQHGRSHHVNRIMPLTDDLASPNSINVSSKVHYPPAYTSTPDNPLPTLPGRRWCCGNEC
jgi:hypothetical protein